MKKTQIIKEDKNSKQVVRFSLVKFFMKKQTQIQIVPENKFCRFLNQTKQ